MEKSELSLWKAKSVADMGVKKQMMIKSLRRGGGGLSRERGQNDRRYFLETPSYCEFLFRQRRMFQPGKFLMTGKKHSPVLLRLFARGTSFLLAWSISRSRSVPGKDSGPDDEELFANSRMTHRWLGSVSN